MCRDITPRARKVFSILNQEQTTFSFGAQKIPSVVFVRKKTTRARCRIKASEARDGIDISTKVGELTTTDLNVENESRSGHTNDRVVRDDFANRIQGCHTQARVARTCVLCVLHRTFISHRSNQKYLAKSVRLSG